MIIKLCDNCGKEWSLGCESCHEKDRMKLVNLTGENLKLKESLKEIEAILSRLSDMADRAVEKESGQGPSMPPKNEEKCKTCIKKIKEKGFEI
jgi:hypothetical protein